MIYSVETRLQAQAAGSLLPLVSLNEKRVGLVIGSGQGSATITVSTLDTMPAGHGMIAWANNVPPFQLSGRIFRPIIQRPWFARFTGAGSWEATVIETIATDEVEIAKPGPELAAIETILTGPNGGQIQICSGNPKRVGLILSSGTLTGNMLVSTQNPLPVSHGLLAGGVGIEPLMLTADQVGPIIQLPWFARFTAAVPFDVTVIEILEVSSVAKMTSKGGTDAKNRSVQSARNGSDDGYGAFGIRPEPRISFISRWADKSLFDQLWTARDFRPGDHHSPSNPGAPAQPGGDR